MSAHQRGPRGMTAFVSSGDNRKDTAVVLLAAAETLGFDGARVIVAANGGFYVSDEFADALRDYNPDDGEEFVEESEPEAATDESKPTKRTSGNRAEKQNSKEE